MTEIDFENCSEEELWQYVASHLAKKGIDTVLVGGSLVSIYTQGAYQSGDIDLIVTSFNKDKVQSALEEIGFKKQNRHYIHPQCQHLFIEFPPGPLGIGHEIQVEPKHRETNEGVKIKLLSATDCIKDRLASYIHFSDQEGMDQAVLVAQNQPCDLNAIKTWCERGGAAEAYETFQRRISQKND